MKERNQLVSLPIPPPTEYIVPRVDGIHIEEELTMSMRFQTKTPSLFE